MHVIAGGIMNELCCTGCAGVDVDRRREKSDLPPACLLTEGPCIRTCQRGQGRRSSGKHFPQSGSSTERHVDPASS